MTARRAVGRFPPFVTGLLASWDAEGFGHDNSDPGVDEAVRAAVDQLRSAGLTAETTATTSA
ncbi:MAG: hypothetical protein OEV40_07190 [Acidimicrobiia bacterium]|nr:hypothetical protein [Acidimicrobiia bacterium]